MVAPRHNPSPLLVGKPKAAAALGSPAVADGQAFWEAGAQEEPKLVPPDEGIVAPAYSLSAPTQPVVSSVSAVEVTELMRDGSALRVFLPRSPAGRLWTALSNKLHALPEPILLLLLIMAAIGDSGIRDGRKLPSVMAEREWTE